jgi:hypothetical protein
MEDILKQKFDEAFQFAISEGWGNGIQEKMGVFKEISTTNALITKTNTGYCIEWKAYNGIDTLVLVGDYNEANEIYDAKMYNE